MNLFLILAVSLPLHWTWAQDDFAEGNSGNTPTSVSLDVSREDLKALKEAFESKQEASVIAASSRILGKDPKHLLTLNTLAVFYFNQGKSGLARIILNRALADHPDQPALYNNLGVIDLADGKQRQAVALFKKALNLKSNYNLGSINLASIYLEYKDYSRAVGPLGDAYKSTRSGLAKGEENSVEVANNYALALAGTGNLEEAAKVFAEVVDSNSRSLPVLLNYAILLVERLNKGQEASVVLSKLKFVADKPEIIKRVEELEKKAQSKEK